MLTSERADLIGKYLAEDKDRAEGLMALSPAEAIAKMNADGNDFSEEEIVEFGNQLSKAAAFTQDGELSEDTLDDVAGGCPTSYYVQWIGIIPVIRSRGYW